MTSDNFTIYRHVQTMLAYLDTERARGLLDPGICAALTAYVESMRVHLAERTMSSSVIAGVLLNVRMAIPAFPVLPVERSELLCDDRR